MKHEITAKRIKEILDLRKMKAQELANASGVAKASISHYLHGTHKPTNISAVKMANVLHVEPMWLMGFDVPMLPVDYEDTSDAYYLDQETSEKIKTLREAKGMSQEELAIKVGYKSRSSINKLETEGRKIPQAKVVALAKALDTTPSALMGWDSGDTLTNGEYQYYLNEETAKKAQEIYDDPNTRILLDARRDLAPEDLDIVVALVKKLKGSD